jgi:DNA-binding IclR family transcriptional regulator
MEQKMDTNVKFKRIQCLDRAMDMLSLICRSSGMTMNEIAAGMELKLGTVYNIVKTLSSRGFLANNNGKYTVGASLGMIASKWDLQSSLPLLVQPILEALSERTGDVTSLTIMNEGKPEIISKGQGSHDGEFITSSHTTWNYPLYLATGRVLLAFGEENLWENEIRRHLKDGPIADDEKEWDFRRWYEMLMQVREDGYSIISPRLAVHGGKQAVGFPLFNPGGCLLAAIGVTCEKENCYKEHLDMVKDAAIEIIRQHPLY